MTLVSAIATSSVAQTREMLDASLVESRIRVEWDVKVRKLLYAIDDQSTFRPMPDKRLFLTRPSSLIVYPRPNPLRLQLSIGIDGADVPDEPVIAALMRSILAMALVSAPTQGSMALPNRPFAPAGAAGCAALGAAVSDLEHLARSLYGDQASPTVGRALRDWRDAIDSAYSAGRDGPQAIDAALNRIDDFLQNVDVSTRAAAALLEKIEAELAQPVPSDPCQASARAVYDSIHVSNPRTSLLHLAAISAVVKQLRQSLAAEYLSSREVGGNRLSGRSGGAGVRQGASGHAPDCESRFHGGRLIGRPPWQQRHDRIRKLVRAAGRDVRPRICRW